MSGFEGFDAYCEEHDIQPGEEPAAFAAYLNQETGWDGAMAAAGFEGQCPEVNADGERCAFTKH